MAKNFCNNIPMLLILNDLMKEAVKSGFLDILFTKGSHHLSTSVAVLTQDVFYKDRRGIEPNPQIF
jgi:hypothetical protein